MRLVRATLALGSLVGATRAAKRGVPQWDEALFRQINSLPDPLAPVVWAPMQAGALGAPLTIGSVLFIRGQRRTGLRIVLTGLAAWWAAKALKTSVGRGRPGVFIDETRLRVGSADDGLGFPSGHAAVVATMIGSIPADAPALVKVGGGVLAITVGLARIHVGAHFPLDVVGGWALGGTIASVYDEILRVTDD